MGSRGAIEIAIEAAVEADCLDDLALAFLPALEAAIGATGALLFEFGAGGQPLGVSGRLATHLATYNETLFGRDPLQAALRLADPRRSRVVALEDVMSYDDLTGSVAFHEFYRPLGVERLIGVWPTEQRFGDPGMVGLVLGRSVADKPFRDRDRRALHRVLPALRGIVARDRKRRSAARERELVGVAVRHSTIVFSPRGQVLWMSPRAEGLASGIVSKLATVARSVAHDYRATGRYEIDQVVETHQARVRIEALAGGALVIIADVSNREGFTDAIMASARALGLTKTEASVLECLARGMDNQSIAAELHVAQATVKTHVQQILSKLGVESRTQAALLAHGLPWRW